MPRNVDVKAFVTDIELLKKRAEELSQSTGTIIIQEDTFFCVPNGRLKLRELQGEPSQLIQYNRPNTTKAKLCEYHVTEVPDAAQLKDVLEHALGILGVVKKRRCLHMVGQTRIHLDKVENLGDFMELEVQLSDSDTVEDGDKIAQNLMTKLNIKSADLIAVAYMDLLLQNQPNRLENKTVSMIQLELENRS